MKRKKAPRKSHFQLKKHDHNTPSKKKKKTTEN